MKTYKGINGILKILIGVLFIAPLTIGGTNNLTTTSTTVLKDDIVGPGEDNNIVQTEAESASQAQRFARIARVSGPAYILRNGITEWEDAAFNMVISEGDRITTENSYMEIQFDNGVSAKVDKNTELEITNLTRDETGEDITSVYVLSGKVKVTVPRYYNAEKRFYIQTPEGGLALEEQAKAQVEVFEGNSKMLVYEGRGKVLSDKGDVSLLTGESTIVRKGQKPAHPTVFSLTYGNFDEWCDSEDEEVVAVSRQYVPKTVVVGVHELDRHGRWVFVKSYGWVWKPNVHFGWRPYYHGHWVYIGRRGWTWVSYEPWGWAPYHYGSWVYEWPYGWVWIPGSVWAPAWVCWYEEPGYISWCPMGPHHRPWFYHSHHHMHMNYWVRVHHHHFKNYKYKRDWKAPEKPYRTSYSYKEVNNKDVKWKNKVNIKPTGIKEVKVEKKFVTATKNVLIKDKLTTKTPMLIDSKKSVSNEFPGKLNEKPIPAKPGFISRTGANKIENKVIESKPRGIESKKAIPVIKNEKKQSDIILPQESKASKREKTRQVYTVKQSKKTENQEVYQVKENKESKQEETYQVKESKRQTENEVRNVETKNYNNAKNVETRNTERKTDVPRSNKNADRPTRSTKGR